MDNLVEKLNSYENDYWDFTEYRDKKALIKYPGMMVAPMQEQLLKDIIEYDQGITSILDPFVGSGTVLTAGAALNLNTYGIDINPLAVLISRVKLEGVPLVKIRESIAEIRTNITLLLGNTEPFEFININKWFREDVIIDLSTIRKAIEREGNIRIRRFFWVCFADTIRKFSNTRSTTFKLHIKEEEKIKSMDNHCIQYFITKISSLYMNYVKDSNSSKANLFTGNSINILEKFPDESIDLICTSPPYGDNHTTITYGQYSILPLLWIDLNDLDQFEVSLLNNLTAIDRVSLGGHNNMEEFEVKIEYEDLIQNISSEKAKKVRYFINDYYKVFLN